MEKRMEWAFIATVLVFVALAVVYVVVSLVISGNNFDVFFSPVEGGDGPSVAGTIFTENFENLDNVNVSSFENVEWDSEKKVIKPIFNLEERETKDDADTILIYHMNDGVQGDGEKINDSSGKSNNGTLKSTTNCNVEARFGVGCEFDKTGGNYISIPESDSMNLSQYDEITWSFWIKPRVWGDEVNGRTILYESLRGGISIWTHGTVLEFFGVGTGGINIQQIPFDKWTHLVVTYKFVDGKPRFSIYQNGIENVRERILDIGRMGSKGEAKIGGNFNSRYFDGLMDEVIIWKRALSAEEVETLYNKGVSSGRFQSKPISFGEKVNTIKAEWVDSENVISLEISKDGDEWCEVENGGAVNSLDCGELPSRNIIYRATLNDKTELDQVVLEGSILDCVDNDNDGYFLGEGCGIELDCNDDDENIHPGALDICDEVDNDCDGEFDDDNVCICSEVLFDENNNLVIDGEKFFPVGFWGIHGGTQHFPQGFRFDEHFNWFSTVEDSIVDYLENSSTNTGGKMMSAAALRVEGLGNNQHFVPNTFENNWNKKGVVAWETAHEANQKAHKNESGQWIYDDLSVDIEKYSEYLRSIDACRKPIGLTPTAGADGDWVNYHSGFVDFLNVQAGYRSPDLDLGGTARTVERFIEQSNNKPVFSIIRIQGYQPIRYRYESREPTIEETRNAAYQSIIAGAKGIYFYSFASAAAGRESFEPISSIYAVENSPKMFEKIKSLGEELKQNSEIFLLPYSTSLSVKEEEGLICKAWNSEEQGADYVICANVEEQFSPYMDSVSGRDNIQILTHLYMTDGEVFPKFECSDEIDNDGDGDVDRDDANCYTNGEYNPQLETEGGPYVRTRTLNTDQVYWNILNSGVTNQDKIVDSFSLNFANFDLAEIKFDWAIFSDGDVKFVNNEPGEDSWFDINRDYGPDTKIISGQASVGSTGLKTFNLPAPLTLEHTRNYALVVRMLDPNVVLWTRDTRNGPRALPGSSGFIDLEEQAGPVRIPVVKNIDLEIQSDSNSLGNYCVQKEIDRDISIGSVEEGKISEEFGPYAVHIYKFANYIGDEVCDDGKDNDCDGLIDDGDGNCEQTGNENEEDDGNNPSNGGPSRGGQNNNQISQCNDGRDNDSDGKVDYPQDEGCVSSLDDSERSSVGTNCVENWECSEWSLCIEGIQERNCVDSNSCESEYDKPLLEIYCSDSKIQTGFFSSLFGTEKNRRILSSGLIVASFIILALILIIRGRRSVRKIGSPKNYDLN